MKRKEKTHVQAKDLWTTQDDVVFLAHCDDLQLALIYMMIFDTSARRHELLALKLGDVKIKQRPDGKKTYAEVEVGRSGKTKDTSTNRI